MARLGAQLAARLPQPERPFTFEVVSADESNVLHEPLVTPGGDVFVSTSLIVAASDEAEFAGMLAQAMERVPVPVQLTRNTGWRLAGQRGVLQDSAFGPTGGGKTAGNSFVVFEIRKAGFPFIVR